MWLKNAWGTSKNRRLDLKVCADLSWLLVFKNGLKKHSSLINDQVIDVWSQCKKHDGGGGEGRRRRGPARVWVLKNGIKKNSSLINDQVIDVWSQCKKNVMEEEGMVGGGGDQLGFGVLICLILVPGFMIRDLDLCNIQTL